MPPPRTQESTVQIEEVDESDSAASVASEVDANRVAEVGRSASGAAEVVPNRVGEFDRSASGAAVVEHHRLYSSSGSGAQSGAASDMSWTTLDGGRVSGTSEDGFSVMAPSRSRPGRWRRDTTTASEPQHASF